MKQAGSCVYGFAGLGLIGGALAMALRKEGVVQGEGRVMAFDLDGHVLEQALSGGVIDEAFNDPREMLKKCDVVFLCINPGAAIRFMEEYIDDFLPGTVITDIAGVKRGIAERMDRIPRDDIDFIPGHPMAGLEKGGYAEADKCSFRGKNYILTPLKRNRKENLDFLRALILSMGFGKITETTPADHDKKIAFTSQLCHVIAAALIDCEGDPEITRFGGGSFEDLTRIAMLNAPMWTELFLENRDELVNCIAGFESSLDVLKNMIHRGEEENLMEYLLRVRQRRSAMVGQ